MLNLLALENAVTITQLASNFPTSVDVIDAHAEPRRRRRNNKRDRVRRDLQKRSRILLPQYILQRVTGAQSHVAPPISERSTPRQCRCVFTPPLLDINGANSRTENRTAPRDFY